MDSGKAKFYDFILDTDSWNLKYSIMNLKNRFKSLKKVLINSDKINGIERNDSTIYLNMTFEELNQSPLYFHDEFGTKKYCKKYDSNNIKVSHFNIIGYN